MTKNDRQSNVRYANVDEANVAHFQAKGYTFADIGGVHKPDSKGNYLMGIPMDKHKTYVDKINGNQRDALKADNSKFPGKTDIKE